MIFLLAGNWASLSARADWTDGKAALSVLGQTDFVTMDENLGNMDPSADSLNRPQGITFDPATGKLFVCDSSNGRVLRYSSAAAFTTGAAAEAVFGRADFVTTGGGSAANELSSPAGATVDSAGRLWVADNLNHRVVMYESAATVASSPNADGLLGQVTFGVSVVGTGQDEMYQPQDVAVDGNGTLWVADWQNNRVLRFDDAATQAIANAANVSTNTAPADGVLGQADYMGTDPNRGGMAPIKNGMDIPWNLAVDAAGNLWVGDAGNSRILYFADAANKADGADPDGLLGQADYVSDALGKFRDRFWGPRGITLDSTGALWVTEEFNNRAVRYENAAALAIANGADLMSNTALPETVLGQPDFVTNPQATTATGMRSAWDVVSSPNGDLWVADFRNNRVLRFQADASSYQGDGQVGLKKSKLKGKNVYNTSGNGQKVTDKSKNRKKLKFYITLENDGEYTDDFLFSGTKKNSFFRVKYFQLTGGKKNVTGSVTKGGTTVPDMAAGGAIKYLVEVKPKSRSKGKRKTRNIKATATSLTGFAKDRVKIKAKTIK